LDLLLMLFVAAGIAVSQSRQRIWHLDRGKREK